VNPTRSGRDLSDGRQTLFKTTVNYIRAAGDIVGMGGMAESLVHTLWSRRTSNDDQWKFVPAGIAPGGGPQSGYFKPQQHPWRRERWAMAEASVRFIKSTRQHGDLNGPGTRPPERSSARTPTDSHSTGANRLYQRAEGGGLRGSNTAPSDPDPTPDQGTDAGPRFLSGGRRLKPLSTEGSLARAEHRKPIRRPEPFAADLG